jgi:hypothetical protein
MKNYNVLFETYVNDGDIRSDCNEISFINKGSDSLLLNGFTLDPGQSLAISGNANEQDTSVYKVSFLTYSNPRLDVIKKGYL